MARKRTKNQAPTPEGKARSDINDVASLAKVSRQTVTNVLYNRTGVYSEDTRERVLRAIAELNYQPHRAARSLRSQRTMQLGFHMAAEQLAPDNAFVLNFIQDLVRAGPGPRGRPTRPPHPGFHRARRRAGRLPGAGRQPRGRRLHPLQPRVDDPRVRFLAEAAIPSAMFGRTAPDLPQTWVDIDNVAAVGAMVNYLVARGHREFAYLGYDAKNNWDLERLEGYRSGLARHGIGAAARSIVRVRTLESVYGAVRRLLNRKHRPTAIVTGSDVLAAGAVNEIRSLGLRPGSDIAVTGFDGSYVRQKTKPTLTSMCVPMDVIAAELIDRCLREIDDGPIGEPGLLVPTEIAVGASA